MCAFMAARFRRDLASRLVRGLSPKRMNREGVKRDRFENESAASVREL